MGTITRGTREWLSLPPSEAAVIMGRWIEMECKSLDTSNKRVCGFTYFTPYESNRFFGVAYKTEMLQDLFGYRLLSRTPRNTDNFSELVFNPDVECEYNNYMNYRYTKEPFVLGGDL